MCYGPALRAAADTHSAGIAEQCPIEAKRAGERTVLEESERQHWLVRLGGVLERLDAAREHSVLPEQPRDPGELEGWLIDLRRSEL